MSTTIKVTGVDVPSAEITRSVELGRTLAASWEQRFSRFRGDSMLSRLNAANGRPVPVDDTFLDVLTHAAAAVRRTDGRFDPSILPALEALGYDRSIEYVRRTVGRQSGTFQAAVGPAGWDQIYFDRNRSEISLPPGMQIDLGGIAKGAFVDYLASRLASWPGGCVDAGGDLWLWGTPPQGTDWVVGIEDPRDPADDCSLLHVPPGPGIGIATSGPHRRRWRLASGEAHHLIDPRTGSPIAEFVRSATALAPTVAAAEVATKALLIAGSEPPLTDLFGAAAAIFVYDDGRLETLTKGKDHAADFSDLAASTRPT
jgi:thiamine biosynthesis lipoprotein